jgi:glycosyltransferase involved in cell wall biosynthesis
VKVLFPLHGFVGWNGGIDLVQLLVSAIELRTADDGIELAFAMPRRSLPQRVASAAFRTWRELRAGHALPSSGRDRSLRSAAEDITAGRTVVSCSESGAGIVRAARASGADIVFPTMLPLGNAPIKRIGYIYDFQHRHLPDLFSGRARRKRDKQFRRIADDSSGIVVNARAVAEDVERLLGFPSSRILAMPFSPYAHPWWFESDPAATVARYGIRDRFVLVCNHFWKHKDHATALRAFAMLRDSLAPENLQLVMTGDPIDHRDPAHYRQLRALCDELGLGGCTHFPGLIPKRDQLDLLRASALLMQPTLYEGGPGGGATFEAIGMGTPAVVSDIPVNREIDQGDVHFFRAGDAIDLAEKALPILVARAGRPGIATLLDQGRHNLAHLGNAISRFLVRIAHGGA